MFMTRWLYGISLWMTTGIFAQFLTDNSTVIGESLFGQNLLGSHFGNIGVSSSFDYVIVGGGTAGLVLARRLAEDTSHTVAVIEAGGFYEMDNSNNSEIPAFALSGMSPLVDWNQTTTPQAQRESLPVDMPPTLTDSGTSPWQGRAISPREDLWWR